MNEPKEPESTPAPTTPMPTPTQPQTPPANTVNVSVEEYNRLKGGQSQYETQIAVLQNDIAGLKTKVTEHGETSGKGTSKETKEQVESRVRGEWQEKVEALETKVGSLTGHLRNRTVVDEVMKHAAGKFLPNCEKWIRKTIAEECSIEGDDWGHPVIVIKDNDGNVRWSNSKANEKLGLAEYVDYLVDQHPEFVPSGTRTGDSPGGEKGSVSAKGQVEHTRQSLSKMTSDQLNDLEKQRPGYMKQVIG